MRSPPAVPRGDEGTAWKTRAPEPRYADSWRAFGGSATPSSPLLGGNPALESPPDAWVGAFSLAPVRVYFLDSTHCRSAGHLVPDLPKVAMLLRILFWGRVVADGLMLAAVTGAIALFGPRLLVGLPGPLFLGAVLFLIARRFAMPHGPGGASRRRR